MYGQDTFQKTLDNIFTTMAIPDIALGTNVIKKFLTYGQIRRAAKDMVSSASKEVTPTRESVTAAAGDILKVPSSNSKTSNSSY